ncbi:unnamed protein product [Soboliphyme baturini]|uniref:Large ribosomal subunit protein uL10 n=1 Tax=Soboliphyme baturini TaxID=241478 RepID=A0A183IE20_9BILA|nr:unnamed protein product [Soboliphyme baturini]
MQEIRLALRGRAELLMGKNTMIRKVIRGYLQKNPSLESLLPHVVGNVGFVFTKEDLMDIRNEIISKKIAAPARAGTIAPIDVILQPVNTGLGPEKTSFFQALSIPTKISKGTIEILSNVHLIKANEKVGASEAALLNMLNILPFTYGLVILKVYDSGSVFHPSVLDITPDDMRNKFFMGLEHMASLCIAIDYPTIVSVPHIIAKGFKNLLSIAIAADISFKEAEKVNRIIFICCYAPCLVFF